MIYNTNSHMALLVIDAQNEYFDKSGILYTTNAQECEENLIKLINKCREKGVIIIFFRHMQRTDRNSIGRIIDFDTRQSFVIGSNCFEINNSLPIEPCDIILDKTRYSCFTGTNLQNILQRKNIDTIIISWLMTNYCCLGTAFSAFDLDYKTIMVIDAVQGPDMPDFGYGEFSHDEIKNYVATTLLGGVADIAMTNELIKKMEE